MLTLDKIAEAMEYMESFGIDPVGGMTVLANTDADFNILNEKVAAEAAAELAPEQAEALMNVGQYLGYVDADIIKVASDLTAQADFMKEAVAEYADYIAANGMNPIDAFTLAGSVYEDGSVDEKVAAEATAIGYTDEHLDFSEKVAYDLYANTGIAPDEALVVLDTIVKEAAEKEEAAAAAEGMFAKGKARATELLNAIKSGAISYKDLLMNANGQGGAKVWGARIGTALPVAAAAAYGINKYRNRNQ